MPCTNTTTTASGTFTVYNKELTKCEAKRFCREKGHILAPITTQQDKDAVYKLLDPRCKEHQGFKFYHLGLDITPCGDTQDRVFTNGVKYDKDIHGSLYIDFNTPQSKCPLAYIQYNSDTPFVIGHKPGCYPQKLKFLCLDQSTAAASPITQSKVGSFTVNANQIILAAGGVLVAFGCFAFATAKFYRENKLLKKELNSFSVSY